MMVKAVIAHWKTARLSSLLAAVPCRLFLAALAYFAGLVLQHGQFPGANYDSYQYVYAAMRADLLTASEITEHARLHVHSGYFPLWRLFQHLGQPVWTAAAWLSMICTAATVAVIYVLARQQGCRHLAAIGAALLFLSFATVAFYASIPEVYAPWLLCLALMLLCLQRQQAVAAAIWLALGIWMFLPALLLLPAFAVLRKGKWRTATAGVFLGLALHLITLRVYGVPFISRLASERVYWQVPTGWLWYFTSTWESLAQSGMGLVLLLSLGLLLALRRRPTEGIRHLLMLCLPLLIAPALWVKDHGSFFLPLGLILSLLCPLLLERWTGRHRWRVHAAFMLMLLVLGTNLRSSWHQLAYDRNMGQAQVSFCQQAVSTLPQDGVVLSTALLSTWLFVKEDAGRGDVQCSYFPWMINPRYGAEMERRLEELQTSPGTYFVDHTVTSMLVEAGELLQVEPIAVPNWPSGVQYWDLKTVLLGAPQP